MSKVASHTWLLVWNESMMWVQIRQRDRFFRMLPYLPAKGLIRYLSTRTATAITLPDYA
jgi:hypothetical protein